VLDIFVKKTLAKNIFPPTNLSLFFARLTRAGCAGVDGQPKEGRVNRSQLRCGIGFFATPSPKLACLSSQRRR
jgi:hypothetical protein